MAIFKDKILNELAKDEKIINERYENFKAYQAKAEQIKGFKEEIYQDGFLRDIFEKSLGYTLNTTNPTDFNIEREKKNETDSKKADAVITLNGGGVGR